MDLSVWYLVGAVLVFFMQCGFAMVEAGFTRAKNAGNIIMKNLMDFCIGTVVFILLGYGIMNSENHFFGLIGKPEYQMFTDFYGFDWSNFFFQLVFCATAATIVSGAMAERTKFLAYCVYSGVISAVIYPIEAGWVWNGQGWLVGLGYVDFAGSSVIHMVGGLSALVGAWMLGPRLGKYTREKDGTLGVNAIPGHSLTLGALGCFILWFCWYGFNGAAAADTAQLAQILGNTTLAPAVATFVCMVFTWKRGGKPDVSMCLNASLAGLVGITAPCATVDALGAIIIGAVDGILVVLVVELLDFKLHIDDPVGAVAVHCANGDSGGGARPRSAPAGHDQADHHLPGGALLRPAGRHGGHWGHRHDGEPGHGLRRSDGQGGPVPGRQDEHAPAAQAPGGHRGGQGGPGPGGGGRRAGAAHRQPGGRQDLPHPRGQCGEGAHRRNGLRRPAGRLRAACLDKPPADAYNGPVRVKALWHEATAPFSFLRKLLGGKRCVNP